MNTNTTTIYHRDGTSEALLAGQARYRTRMHPEEWSLTPWPPVNWEYQIPKYRVTRDLQPAQFPRVRAESPIAESWQYDVWQYAERQYSAGEEIETTAWPDPSMRPLNYSAQKVLEFFNCQMKSRLPVSPWHEGRVRLDNGFNNAPAPVPQPLQIQPMNLRPVA